jgi:hypothetical protein
VLDPAWPPLPDPAVWAGQSSPQPDATAIKKQTAIEEHQSDWGARIDSTERRQFFAELDLKRQLLGTVLRVGGNPLQGAR